MAGRLLVLALILALVGLGLQPIFEPSVGAAQGGAPSAAPGQAQGPPFVPGQIIISFRLGVTDEEIADLYRQYDIKQRKDLDSDRHDNDPEERLVAVRGVLTQRLLEQLNQDPRTEYAELNYILSANVHPPNDPSYDQLWGLNNTGQTGGTADADIDAPEAWHSFTTGSASVIIGVIDTGVEYDHPDLIANMWSNPGETPGDGIDNDGNGYVDDVHGINAITSSGDPLDDHGHGSHVAGTIGATGNNSTGVVGVNWTVRVAACKFLDSSGSGTTADAVECVKYFNKMKNVYGQNVVVTNNSWGGGGFSQALEDALAGLDQPGMSDILHAAAAGNSDNDNDASPHYPSSYGLDNIIAVAATDHDDLYASFSSYGATSVDIAAPGVNILSTVPTGGCSLCTGTKYKSLNGTSMATPHVAGVAGLLWANYPALTASAAKSRLLSSADPLSDLSKQTLTNGRLNAFNSLENDTVSPSAVSDLTVSGSTLTSVSLSWTAVGDDGLTGTANAYDIRYSTSPISAANWDAATQVGGEPGPQPSGSTEAFAVTGLDYSTNYYFGVKVIDNVGNVSGLSNVPSGATSAAVIAFSDDMESGTGGWTATGLWNLDTFRSVSPTHAWYYGNPSTRNYNAGSNSGALTSPAISLSDATDAALTFYEWSEVESNINWDRTRVQLSADGASWITAFESHGTNGAWIERTVGLASYVGGDVYIRFWFDTIDSFLNNYEGWYVDDVVVLKAGDQVPVAEAGGPYSGDEGSVIAFSSAGSNDPDGTIVSYDWSFGDSTTGTGPSPSHAYADNGTYTVTLTVTDDAGLQGSDTASVMVANVAAIASAGGPYSGDEGVAVVFSGSATDPGADILTYEWDFDYDGATFDVNATGVDLTAPEYTYAQDDSYTVALRVNDDDGATSGVSTAAVTVNNVVPTASAGGTYWTNDGTPVVFSGSATDPGSDVLTYEWDFDYDGTTFDVDATGVDLTAPEYTYAQDGSYTAALRVSDGDGATSGVSTATVTVDALVITNTALGITDITNSSPTHGASPLAITDGVTTTDGWVGLNPGPQWVQLDLGGQYDISRVNVRHYYGGSRTYRDVILQLSADRSSWVTIFNNDADNSTGQGVGSDGEYGETPAGLDVSLASLTRARYVRSWSSGSNANGYNHYVELEVYGDSAAGAGAANQAPSVDAGVVQEVTLPSSATLSGTASDDGLPGGALTTTWSKTSGPGTVTFGDASLVDTTATFSVDGIYVLRLTADDGELSAFDEVTITVNPEPTLTNVALGITDINTSSLTHGASPSAITDGATTTDGWVGLNPGPQWVQLDLGGQYDISMVNVRHYYGGPRTYRDVILQLSTDGSSWVTIFNNDADNSTGQGVGSDGEYGETAAGLDVSLASPIQARYVRSWINGSNANGYNHYVELEAYGVTAVGGPTNQAPIVNAGANQEVTRPSSAALNGTVSDDGLPGGGLTTTWSKTSGPGTVTFGDASLVDTTATFSVGGIYVLRLTANDGELSAFDETTITVNDPNVALGITDITTSSPTHGAPLSVITDGATTTDGWVGLNPGPQWVQLDLGGQYNISWVNVRHYYGDPRTYRDVVLQLSTDGASWVTIFNNDADNSSGQGVGSDGEYGETPAGLDILLTSPIQARYVRSWSNGSNANGYNHYVELEAYGATVP